MEQNSPHIVHTSDSLGTLDSAAFGPLRIDRRVLSVLSSPGLSAARHFLVPVDRAFYSLCNVRRMGRDTGRHHPFAYVFQIGQTKCSDGVT